MNDKMACQDCGKELSAGVIEAGELLYGSGTISVSRLAEYLERSLRPNERARWDADRAARYQLPPVTDAQIVEMAISSLFEVDDEDMAAAVRHYGNLGDPDGTECERTNAARWCSVRGPGKDSQDSIAWAASFCNLEAGHGEPHSFEQAPAATVS